MEHISKLRKCRVCKGIGPEEGFVKAKGKYTNRCKACLRAANRKRRADPEYKVKEAAYTRSRHANETLEERQARVDYKREWNHTSDAKSTHRNRYTNNPDEWKKRRARECVRRALRSGKLVRPEICELCKENPGLGANGVTKMRADHYWGYEPENALNVRWICAQCDELVKAGHL